MSLLNGTYEFYFSEEQKEEAEKAGFEDRGYYRPQFVIIPADESDKNGKKVEYTECVHLSNKNDKDWKDHEDRYEDSKFLGEVRQPKISRGQAVFGRKGVS